MSKSLGNVILAKQFAKKYGPNVFRYLILNSRYKQVINFEETLVNQAVNYIEKITNLIKKIEFRRYLKKINLKKISDKSYAYQALVKALANNLNTVKSLFILEELISFINKEIENPDSFPFLIDKISEFY
jgi:cysteinyl-tRNA synthetase